MGLRYCHVRDGSHAIWGSAATASTYPSRNEFVITPESENAHLFDDLDHLESAIAPRRVQAELIRLVGDDVVRRHWRFGSYLMRPNDWCGRLLGRGLSAVWIGRCIGRRCCNLQNLGFALVFCQFFVVIRLGFSLEVGELGESLLRGKG
jgi:hypothetical protein